MTFVRADGVAGNRSDNFPRCGNGDKNRHNIEALLEAFWRQHCVFICAARVAAFVALEGRAQAAKNATGRSSSPCGSRMWAAGEAYPTALASNCCFPVPGLRPRFLRQNDPIHAPRERAPDQCLPSLQPMSPPAHASQNEYPLESLSDHILAGGLMRSGEWWMRD